MIDNKFITNYTENTFLENLKTSIEKCNSFSFSVSFIKKAGLVLLEKIIEEALKRGVTGKIITSTYQNFTDIASLRTFYNWQLNYPNFECHLDLNCFGDNGFHSKGYLFEYNDSYEFIVGSTNITRFALLKNIEWNVSLKSREAFESKDEADIEFDSLWKNTKPLTPELIKEYQMQLEYSLVKWDMDFFDPVSSKIKPNAMQRTALKELRRYRDMGINKALVVSATGSGKTYLSAFDARNYDAKRVLFVVHRDKILSDAKDTFMKVFGAEKTYGLYVGKHKEIDCDFLFASNIMLSQHLNDFKPDEFDYIVMDECHHAAASTYKSIMEYFKPGFLLGITATPERMDNQDVFAMFDKNVPYELRLRDAIINDLVVPFHYYGIRDKLVDYKFKDNTRIAKEIAKAENIEFIKEEIEKHKPVGKLKAIAFCTSVAHAILMADELENVGYCSVALTGNNDLGQRIKAFKDLQDDSNPLEIICTVDILNEGVDIPATNMVLFLRPTESSTIFIQQLGRGMRKYEGKQYVTVLDFIGNNYDRSIQMARALGSLGKTTVLEKPFIMDMIRTDFKALNIPGVMIHIDELSKEEIIDFLKKENFNSKEYLKKDYENFKIYLKKETYPSHLDFLNNDCAPDLMRLMKSSIGGNKSKSYYSFLKTIGEPKLEIFTNEQIRFIDSVSELLPLVRIDEYLLLQQLLIGKINIDELIGKNSKVTKDTLENALFHLKKDKILNGNNEYNIDSKTDSFIAYLEDLLDYGLQRYDIEFGEYEGKFKLYGNYFKEQIQKIRLKEGTMYVKGTEFPENDIPYFYVGLNKTGNKKTNFDYKDEFLSASEFQWESVKDTTFKMGDGPKLAKSKQVHLFIRKMEKEDSITLPFTYFGIGTLVNPRPSTVDTVEKGIVKTHPTVMYDVILENPVPEEYWFDFEIPESIVTN